MNAWAFDGLKLSSKSPTLSTLSRAASRWVGSILVVAFTGCVPAPTPPVPAQSSSSPAESTSVALRGVANEPTTQVTATNEKRPVVLLDSFHAHNFIDRGLIPGEHTYHRFTSLRRAVRLLEDRQVEVRELVVGPITDDRLSDVRLIVLNLPSMDRPPWLVSEIEAVERFIRRGGGILFITDHSNCYYHQYHLLPLWQRLGLLPTFETTCERAEKNLLAHSGPGWILIRDFEKHPVTENVRYFAMQTGGRVVGDSIIARTSDQAWADAGLAPLYGEGKPGLTGDLQHSAGEDQGAQGVLLAKTIDRGRAVVISDQNALGDAFLSYADNWRVWLKACDWAGQLKIDCDPLPIEKIAMLRITQQASSAPASPPASTFDQIIAGERDRNAQPVLPMGSWQCECWEDLSQGNFYWGSTDEDRFYFFWCWLNRWCWTSAHESPSNPSPSGRILFLARQADSKHELCRRRIEQVLRQGGKIILLGNGADSNEQVARDAAERQKNLERLLSNWMQPVDASRWLATATWQEQPLWHAHLTLDGASIVVVPFAELLQNSSFTAPETAPNARQSKWQLQLYHWLFEQS